MSATRHWLADALLTGALLTVCLKAQSPAAPPPEGARLDAVFAAAEARTQVPAIAWLCERYLPSLPIWPAQLDPAGPFALTLDASGVQVRATRVPVPSGEVARGALSFADATRRLTFACNVDGAEQWFVPADLEPPDHLAMLLRGLDAEQFGQPRTVSASVIAGHLAGGLLSEDPRAVALQLGSAMCGDVTWITWRSSDGLRVRGRSDGGLMLPAMLLAIAISDGTTAPAELLLRAFAGRDGDRAEAVRQLGRDDLNVDGDTSALCAMLSADDEVRLVAIDALVRRGASERLPEIVAAARPDAPWAQLAAVDAVQALWSGATTGQREATRNALRQSRCTKLRDLDVDRIQPGNAPPTAAIPTDPGARARLLLLLLLTSIGLFGLWSRSRLHLASAA